MKRIIGFALLALLAGTLVGATAIAWGPLTALGIWAGALAFAAVTLLALHLALG